MISEKSKNSPNQALEERLSNMHEQMAGVTSRLDRTEHELDLERATREDIIKAEVERRIREAEQRIREKVEAEYAGKFDELDARKADLDRREGNMQQAFELMGQRLIAETEQKIRKAKDDAESHFLGKMAAQTEGFLRLFSEMASRKNADIQDYLAKFKVASEEAQAAISNEIKTKLERIFKNEQSKNRQIAELVRMIFTQKRERFLVSEDDRTSIHERILASLELTDDQKAEYKHALDTVKKYRLQKEAERLARKEQHKDGHGRNMIPEDMIRLPEILVYPEECIGHMDEYREVFPGETTEFIIPVTAKYMVQGYRNPVMVRKDDIDQKFHIAPVHEELIWKSYASNKLLAQLEVRKYMDHMPFNRQISQMKRDGLVLAPSTVNDWHVAVCDTLVPLYRLQEYYVMLGLHMAADGSPMPVVDNERHKTVKQYIIEYRNIDTGIPIFLTTVGKGCGRGKEVIQAQLANWSGLALICDAYPGYDWLKKIGRVLCRCSAHARRDHERALKENPKAAMPGMLLFQEIYGVEEIIRHENATGSRITELRNELARPLWETFHLWCLNEILNHDQNSQMYKALNYVIRHYEELTAYLDIPEMPLDNNETEREIRAMVMGKKAYLFCQTDEACERAAMMYSFFGACKVMGKNPERWLTYVLDHIGTTKEEDLYKLLPEFWEDIN
ncbi:MAG: IS66 family transposase [Clostridiales bacterium]|nr:IS66 family transposase [Clostridiales bacterium]